MNLFFGVARLPDACIIAADASQQCREALRLSCYAHTDHNEVRLNVRVDVKCTDSTKQTLTAVSQIVTVGSIPSRQLNLVCYISATTLNERELNEMMTELTTRLSPLFNFDEIFTASEDSLLPRYSTVFDTIKQTFPLCCSPPPYTLPENSELQEVSLELSTPNEIKDHPPQIQAVDIQNLRRIYARRRSAHNGICFALCCIVFLFLVVFGVCYTIKW
jgi:hypothetical protein